jgi:hypothetical protein
MNFEIRSKSVRMWYLASSQARVARMAGVAIAAGILATDRHESVQRHSDVEEM